MVRVLVKLGFILVHQKGSHMKFERTSRGKKETIVFYNHHTVKKGILTNIIDQLGLSVEELKELL